MQTYSITSVITEVASTTIEVNSIFTNFEIRDISVYKSRSVGNTETRRGQHYGFEIQGGNA
jgi:hypothetical protein